MDTLPSSEVLDPSRIQPENKKKKEKGTGRRSPNIFSSVPDPGTGAFLTTGSGIRDGEKNQDPDPG